MNSKTFLKQTEVQLLPQEKVYPNNLVTTNIIIFLLLRFKLKDYVLYLYWLVFYSYYTNIKM